MDNQKSERLPSFSFETVMDLQGYSDFSLLVYSRLVRVFLPAFVIICAISVWFGAWRGRFDLGFSLCFLGDVVLCLAYIRTGRRIKRGYIQLRETGNLVPYTTEFFDDKILVNFVNSDGEKEYSYAMIDNIFESQLSYIFSVGDKGYIVVDKKGIRVAERDGFLSFIFNRTTKKKLIRLDYKKTVCALICCMLSALVIFFGVMTFKNEQFTSVKKLIATDFGDSIYLQVKEKIDLESTLFMYTVSSPGREGSYRFVTKDPDYKITTPEVYDIANAEGVNIYSIDEEYIFVSAEFLSGIGKDISLDEYLGLDFSQDQKRDLITAFKTLVMLNDSEIDVTEVVKILQYENINIG